jgi:hypothetical protein
MQGLIVVGRRHDVSCCTCCPWCVCMVLSQAAADKLHPADGLRLHRHENHSCASHCHALLPAALLINTIHTCAGACSWAALCLAGLGCCAVAAKLGYSSGLRCRSTGKLLLG